MSTFDLCQNFIAVNLSNICKVNCVEHINAWSFPAFSANIRASLLFQPKEFLGHLLFSDRNS